MDSSEWSRIQRAKVLAKTARPAVGGIESTDLLEEKYGKQEILYRKEVVKACCTGPKDTTSTVYFTVDNSKALPTLARSIDARSISRDDPFPIALAFFSNSPYRIIFGNGKIVTGTGNYFFTKKELVGTIRIECPRMRAFSSNKIPLTSIGFNSQFCKELIYVYVLNAKLTQLNMPYMPALTRLYCTGNLLTSLDVSQLPNLSIEVKEEGGVWCDRNNLSQAAAEEIVRQIIAIVAPNPRTGVLGILNQNGGKLSAVGEPWDTLRGLGWVITDGIPLA